MWLKLALYDKQYIQPALTIKGEGLPLGQAEEIKGFFFGSAIWSVGD